MSTFPAHDALVFVDLETTGANFANDRIIEIGLIEVDRDGVREWSTLVDPGRPVPPFITGLTGIDTAMVAAAPTFAQVAPALVEKLRGRLFVAHNARFDYGFLKHEFRRAGIDFRATSLCTVKLSRALFPGHRRHNLDTLVERYGVAIPAGERHRALGDARVLWDLWRHWHTLLPGETIREAVERITGRPELPPQLDPALLDDLPEAPGAYAVFGQDGVLLTAKRAANLRQQVFAHFAPARRDSALVRDAWRIEWREAAGEFGARLRELELNAARRRPPEELYSWRLVRHGDGDFRPELVHAGEIDFTRTDDLFGLYHGRREAIQALRKLAEAHRLCHHFTGLGNGRAGEACVAYRQRGCRGACVGKEPVSLHSARLMAALAKHRIRPWPYSGPIALVERDEFGMREDAHVINDWGYLGTASDETTLRALFEEAAGRGTADGSPCFDPDIYRIVVKCLQEGRLRVVSPPLP
jgi:DNA polymerase-3 subunit epsilon